VSSRAVEDSAGGIVPARCSGDPFSLAWPAADMVVIVNCQSGCDVLLVPVVAWWES
jgi:hypothetical protein